MKIITLISAEANIAIIRNIQLCHERLGIRKRMLSKWETT